MKRLSKLKEMFTEGEPLCLGNLIASHGHRNELQRDFYQGQPTGNNKNILS